MTSQLLQRPGKFALTISLLLPLIVGCTTTQAVDQTSYSTTAAQGSFSEAQLDSLLAPIALYPDTVLSHVLIASTYPLEVVEADRWVRNNRHLTGDNAVNAVDNEDWDPSVKALVAFPEILKRMSEDLEWTQQLGDAFLADEARVMDSVQTLRNRAYASGNLDKVEHVRVIREAETIVIEPSVERVVYVPAYDPRVVYGNWWWADYPPVYWHYPSSYVFVSGFYWGPSVYIGPRFYFSGCHWAQHRVVVVDHYHDHHHFYDSRSVAHYAGATHWNHNPVHRRGVAYHDNHISERYHSNRENYGDARVYRAGLRDNGGHAAADHGAVNRQATSRQTPDHLTPNHARDQRQGRDEQFQQRLGRQQAGQVTTNSDRPAQYQNQQPRAEQLRERMNRHNNRELGNVQNREQGVTNQPRTEHQSADNRTADRSNSNPRAQSQGASETRTWENRGNSDRINRVGSTTSAREPQPGRVARAEQPREQQQGRTGQVARTEPVTRTGRPSTQWEERPIATESAQPVERAGRPQVQREAREVASVDQADRPERAERTERVERTSGGSHNSGERAEMRGGRER